MPRRAIALGGRVTFLSRHTTRPRLADTAPAMARSSVVLPAPLRPSTANRCGSSISKVRPSSAIAPEYSTRSPSALIMPSPH
jgi:hypothetical protein